MSTIDETNDNNDRLVVHSENIISAQWDKCLERTAINFGVGFLVGALTAVVATKSPTLRNSIRSFGAGAGVGVSWVHCSQEFEKCAQEPK